MVFYRFLMPTQFSQIPSLTSATKGDLQDITVQECEKAGGEEAPEVQAFFYLEVD